MIVEKLYHFDERSFSFALVTTEHYRIALLDMFLVDVKSVISDEKVQLVLFLLVVLVHLYNEIGPCQVSTACPSAVSTWPCPDLVNRVFCILCVMVSLLSFPALQR